MAKKSRKLLVAIMSGVILVSIVLTLVVRIPPASQQLPPNSAPVMVAIIHPTDGSGWSADTPIPVAAMAAGQVPVRKLELWVDARLFDTQEFSGEHIYAYHAWSWMPLTQGGHSLYVRAIDANGRTADSNVVNIQAAATAGFLAVKTTSGGETLQSLADQNGLTLDQVSAQNPSIAPLSPISPGTQIFLPLQFAQIPAEVGSPPLPPVISGPVDPAVIGQPGNTTFLIERALNNSKNLPTPPALAAVVGVCNVTLTIQDNSDPEDGFFVYGLNEGATSFHRLTSLQAHKGTGDLQYTVPNQRGHVEFYVSSYNASGEAKSAPVAVDVTAPQCNPGSGSQGNVKYEGGYLIMPASIQLAYLYASVNGGTWQRIPTDHLFMSPTAGKVDLRSKVQQLLGGASSGEVDLDVWGWSGGVLEHLGQVHVNINFASLAICDLGTDCSGDMGSTHWVNAATVGSDQLKTTRAFRWSAQGIDITYGIWQVSTQPFPAEYSIGAPPGLIISGSSQAYVSESGNAGGDFQIDFKSDLQTANMPAQPKRTGFDPLHLWSSNKIESTYIPIFLSQFGKSPFPGLYQAMLPQILYVRVAPMAGGHLVGDPSNTVAVTYTPTGPTPTVHIYKVPTYKVEIVPGSYVNEVHLVQKMGTLGCSIITGVDHDKYIAWFVQEYTVLSSSPVFQGDVSSLAEQSYQMWADHINWKICPGIVEEKGDTWYDQILTGLEGAWDGLASAIEQIKGTLVSALASIIPGCDSTCQEVLMTGLNFAVTYFTGLPPSMPSFKDGVSAGLNYAVQMAISEAGVPYCDDICTGKITEEVQSLASDLASSPTQPGCGATGTYWVYEGTQLYHLKPLCIPPGISFIPVEGSAYEHGLLQVKVSRIDGSPQPAPGQLLLVEGTAFNGKYADGHTATETLYGNFYNGNASHIQYQMIYNAPLTGTPYPLKTIPIPAMKAGESIVIPVVLNANFHNDTTLADAYPARLAAIQALNLTPEEMDSVKNNGWMNWYSDFQHLTDSGSLIFINAKMLCQDQSMAWLYTSPCAEPAASAFTVP